MEFIHSNTKKIYYETKKCFFQLLYKPNEPHIQDMLIRHNKTMSEKEIQNIFNHDQFFLDLDYDQIELIREAITKSRKNPKEYVIVEKDDSNGVLYSEKILNQAKMNDFLIALWVYSGEKHYLKLFVESVNQSNVSGHWALSVLKKQYPDQLDEFKLKKYIKNELFRMFKME